MWLVGCAGPSGGSWLSLVLKGNDIELCLLNKILIWMGYVGNYNSGVAWGEENGEETVCVIFWKRKG